MKTLVIHPEDISTDFLKPIYADRRYEVLTGHKSGVNSLLPRYGRVIMMGHGIPSGLFTMGKFPGFFAIDEDSVAGLREKNNVYIWCWANRFVVEHGLKGFATGMFISEVGEAKANGIDASQEEVNRSNALFAAVMRTHIQNPRLKDIVREYDGNSPVIKYNRAQMQEF